MCHAPSILVAARLVAALIFTAAGAASAPRVQPEPGHATERTQSEPAPASRELPDAELAGYRAELLDLAFRAGSAFPQHPHLKNRALAQHHVVETCLELGQLARARRYAEAMGTWRRQAALAEIAEACARRGLSEAAIELADLAEHEARTRIEREEEVTSDTEDSLDWRKARVLSEVARARAALGQAEASARTAAQAGTALQHAVEASTSTIDAKAVDPAAFERAMAAVDAAAATADFDTLQAALRGCASLFERCYEQPELRARAESKMKACWTKMPLDLRVDLVLEMAGAAIDHRDPSKARDLLDEAETLEQSGKWLPENQVPLMARIARLRFRAGQADEARLQAKAARELFDAARERIVDIYRAGALRPLAEASLAMGDVAAARALYAAALEEGVRNPNARPRAMDLIDTCRSMAREDFEPPRDMRERIEAIAAGLGDPW